MDFKRKKVSDAFDSASRLVESEAAPADLATLSGGQESSQPEPAAQPTQPVHEAADDATHRVQRIGGQVLKKSWHLLELYGGLLLSFLVFYALADYTASTTADQRPGQLVYSNTMVQLWTACFRLAFVLGASLGLLRLFWPELFQFFRPDTHEGPDMMNTIKYELTSFQRLCIFLLAFFGLCFLFILLLSVNLPQTTSVGL